MVYIDRMSLEDVGDNPRRLAEAVLEQADITSKHVPIHDIAQAVDIIEIREENLINFEGALITTPGKADGIILVRRDAPKYRKRFTIGHELGHFLIGYHQPIGGRFECTSADMRKTSSVASNRALKMEVEANRFAAELLMPRKLIQRSMKTWSEPEISHIISISEDYHVSKEAAARRYVELIDEPLAIIFTKNNTVRYWLKNKEFPTLNIRSNSKVFQNCLTSTFQDQANNPSDLILSEVDFWLRDGSEGSIFEQVLIQQDGHRMTLLSFDPSNEEDSDWEEPRFRK